MKRTKFYIHSVWVEDIINGLTTIPDSVKLEVYQAIMQYGFYRNLDGLNLSDMAIGLFAGIRPQLDGGWEAYDRQCECNRKNGNKGGAPKGNRNAMKKEEEGNNPKQPIRLISVDSRNYSESESELESDLELDSDKIKNKIKYKKSKESANAPKKGETLSLTPSKGVSSLSDREKAFAETIRPYVPKYGKEMCNKFFAYWTEPNKSKTKMRFELERTWDVSRRLATWSNKPWGDNKPVTPAKGMSDRDIEALEAGQRIIDEKRRATEAAHTPEAEAAREAVFESLKRKMEGDTPTEGAPFIDDKHKFDNETGW